MAAKQYATGINFSILRLTICLLLFTSISWVKAQPSSTQTLESDQAVLKKGESRITLFDVDSTFYCNLRLRVQNRVEYLSNVKDAASQQALDARVRRLRLRFDGGLPIKGLTYLVQLNFADADLDAGVVGEPAFVRDAMIYYKPDERQTIAFGLGKLPGNRQRVISSGNLQFAERSLSNAFFNIDRDFGVQYHVHLGTQSSMGNYPANIKLAVSRGDGRLSQITDLGLCYTGRVEWLPLPNFEKNGDYAESDLTFHDIPALSIGVTGGLNAKADRTAGQLGLPLGYKTNIYFFFADALLKYKGWSILAELHMRRADTTVTGIVAKRPVAQGHGSNVQVGKLVGKNYELVARFSHVTPHKGSMNFTYSSLSTLGVNRFFNGHRVKLQGYINYFNTGQSISSGKPIQRWGAGCQFEFGF